MPSLSLHNQTSQPENVQKAIEDLLGAKDYPCIPAILSLQNREYMVGTYSNFGSGSYAQDLYRDLIHFSKVQKKSKSLYLSYWAVFMDQTEMTEDQFEQKLWRELSLLSSKEDSSVPWDPNFSSDPKDKKFCLSFGGEAFFIVGLHPQSSRKARKFPWPAVIFNLYDQFEELDRQGRYQSIVQKNRARELKYQGDLNPMVEKHGDKWEAIQFSGKDNPSDWKCPFHRMIKK